jgi:hypothetical protein
MKEKNAYFILCLLRVMAILYQPHYKQLTFPQSSSIFCLAGKNHISLSLSHCPLLTLGHIHFAREEAETLASKCAALV